MIGHRGTALQRKAIPGTALRVFDVGRGGSGETPAWWRLMPGLPQRRAVKGTDLVWERTRGEVSAEGLIAACAGAARRIASLIAAPWFELGGWHRSSSM